MRYEFPMARAGQHIGLLGGSFDPAHAGHLHISVEALKRFRLDQVWWLVSPGNPLKQRGPEPLAKRMARAKDVAQHPKIVVTDIERLLETRYTHATLSAMIKHFPSVRFTWLMGADNLATFHHWEQWRGIIEIVPVGVLARPGDRISARMSPAARAYRHARLRARASHLLSVSPAPSWCFVNVPMHNASSTAIRADGGWN
jgi:nicotinate-nucleotide adenylyltransferase